MLVPETLFKLSSGQAFVVSGLAPRWAAQRPHQKRERYALKRGASPLTTVHSMLRLGA